MKDYVFLIPFIIFFVGMAYISYSSEGLVKSPVFKLSHGIASKVEFEGHSYVIWQQNWTDCIIHDPDCQCNKKDK